MSRRFMASAFCAALSAMAASESTHAWTGGSSRPPAAPHSVASRESAVAETDQLIHAAAALATKAFEEVPSTLERQGRVLERSVPAMERLAELDRLGQLAAGQAQPTLDRFASSLESSSRASSQLRTALANVQRSLTELAATTSAKIPGGSTDQRVQALLAIVAGGNAAIVPYLDSVAALSSRFAASARRGSLNSHAQEVAQLSAARPAAVAAAESVRAQLASLR